jgi:hypothetical protein
MRTHRATTPHCAVACLLLLLAGGAAAQTEEKSYDGDGVDHIVLLVPDRSPARFVGPDLALRELRYASAEASNAVVRGTMSFGRKSPLVKRLRRLLKDAQEFEMVIYFLVGDELERVRFERVRVEAEPAKHSFQWTAAAPATQSVP